VYVGPQLVLEPSLVNARAAQFASELHQPPPCMKTTHFFGSAFTPAA